MHISDTTMSFVYLIPTVLLVIGMIGFLSISFWRYHKRKEKVRQMQREYLSVALEAKRPRIGALSCHTHGNRLLDLMQSFSANEIRRVMTQLKHENKLKTTAINATIPEEEEDDEGAHSDTAISRTRDGPQKYISSCYINESFSTIGDSFKERMPKRDDINTYQNRYSEAKSIPNQETIATVNTTNQSNIKRNKKRKKKRLISKNRIQRENIETDSNMHDNELMEGQYEGICNHLQAGRVSVVTNKPYQHNSIHSSYVENEQNYIHVDSNKTEVQSRNTYSTFPLLNPAQFEPKNLINSDERQYWERGRNRPQIIAHNNQQERVEIATAFHNLHKEHGRVDPKYPSSEMTNIRQTTRESQDLHAKDLPKIVTDSEPREKLMWVNRDDVTQTLV